MPYGPSRGTATRMVVACGIARRSIACRSARRSIACRSARCLIACGIARRSITCRHVPARVGDLMSLPRSRSGEPKARRLPCPGPTYACSRRRQPLCYEHIFACTPWRFITARSAARLRRDVGPLNTTCHISRPCDCIARYARSHATHVCLLTERRSNGTIAGVISLNSYQRLGVIPCRRSKYSLSLSSLR